MRDYDNDFKEEVIKLSYEIGPKEAVGKLGIPGTTLYTWKNRTKKYGAIAFIGSGNKRLDPKTAEIREMEKKIKELEVANDILIRALVFFAESQKK
jgi:transposase